jgi:hydrogenase maturation protease
VSLPATLVVGIGSPHGDDQAGWRVIDLLSQSAPRACQLSRAKVPHELLDGLGDVELMHVVDAYAPTSAEDGLQRFELAVDHQGSDELAFAAASAGDGDLTADPNLRSGPNPHSGPNPRSGTTHHIDLISVMRLAQTLRTLPPRVVLWTIPGHHFDPTTQLDADCETQVRLCAGRIRCELSDA